MRILILCALCALAACQAQPAAPSEDSAPADTISAEPAAKPAAAPAPAAPAVEPAPTADVPSGPPPTRPSKELDIPLLVPGEAIGPFKLGATMEALVKAGHKLEPHPSGQLGDNVKVSGPFYLVFEDQGRLTSIELDLTQSAMRYGSAKEYKIVSHETPFEELRKLMGCGALQIYEGGNVSTCNMGTLLKQAGPVGKPSVQVLIEPGGASK
jgi:hypothetical protein